MSKFFCFSKYKITSKLYPKVFYDKNGSILCVCRSQHASQLLKNLINKKLNINTMFQNLNKLKRNNTFQNLNKLKRNNTFQNLNKLNINDSIDKILNESLHTNNLHKCKIDVSEDSYKNLNNNELFF
jgi:hypothetical protein